MKVTYTSETLFSYYNNGKSPITYNYKASKTISSYTLKVSGGVKLQTQKDNKVFGSGLTASLNMDYVYDNKTEDVETFDIKVSIEPTTQMVLYLYGEGKITNGVAKNYLFWIEIAKGGFEIFVIPDYYVMATDSDFNGTSDGTFTHSNSVGHIIIPDVIKVFQLCYTNMFAMTNVIGQSINLMLLR